MRRARARVALVMLPLALAAAACGGGGDGSTAEEGWMIGLLRRIPDTADSAAEVTLGDLSAAAAAAGVGRPAPGAPAIEATDFLASMPRDLLLPPLLADSAPELESLRAELGFDPTLVSTAAAAGRAPSLYQAMTGDFSASAIEDAVRTDPAWSALLEEGEHSGVAYYSWGNDFQIDVTRVTGVRKLGQGGRLALDDGCLYWAVWTAGIEGMIDAGAGLVPSLADREPLRRVAEALEDAGVYSAILTDDPLLEDAAVSGPTLGIGGGRDEAGAFWVMVAIHDDAASAEEAAAAVRAILGGGTLLSTGQPWSERVASFEVTVEGDMLVAVVRSSGREGDWMQAYYRRESIIPAAQG